jgi:hypothetical protein
MASLEHGTVIPVVPLHLLHECSAFRGGRRSVPSIDEFRLAKEGREGEIISFFVPLSTFP